MTAYPSLNRWLAAGLTLLVLGGAIFVISRNGANPIDPNPLQAQPAKGNQDWIRKARSSWRRRQTRTMTCCFGRLRTPSSSSITSLRCRTTRG